MAKIKFTLDAWLKDKSQKVETRDGRIVHNIWSVKEPFYTNNKKAEVCALIDGEEDALVFFEGGRYLPTTQDIDNPFDLFIITPEPELTSWQTFISGCLQKHGLLDCGAADRIAKECSAELLDLARKEALKDLPRWESDSLPSGSAALDISALCGFDFIRRAGRMMRISSLEKLPGFKED